MPAGGGDHTRVKTWRGRRIGQLPARSLEDERCCCLAMLTARQSAIPDAPSLSPQPAGHRLHRLGSSGRARTLAAASGEQGVDTSSLASSMRHSRRRHSLDTPTGADLLCYADRYTDLGAAFGHNVSALLEHWRALGRAEGRNPFCGSHAGAASKRASHVHVAIRTYEGQVPTESSELVRHQCQCEEMSSLTRSPNSWRASPASPRRRRRAARG